MCKECKEEKVRKVFLDDLPRWKEGANKGRTNWKECEGHKVKFIYEGLEGSLIIEKYKYPNLIVKYKDYDSYKIHISTFINCGIKGVIINDIYDTNSKCRDDVWMDLKGLPLMSKGIDWFNCVGMSIDFKYEGISGKLDILNFNKSKQSLSIRYLDYEPFNIKISNFVYGKIGNYLGKYSNDFKVEIGTHFKDDKRDLIITDRKYIKSDNNGYVLKYYKYKCNKCGFSGGKNYDSKKNLFNEEYWIAENSLLRGRGCSCCCSSPQIVVEGINDIPTTTPWMVKYFQGGYDEAKKHTNNSEKLCYFKCPDCGRNKNKKLKIMNVYNIHSINCTCGDGFSYPEKFMYSLLEQLNLEFQTEYSPDWIKPKRYDFYIPSKNLIIETDGGWHRIDNKMSGQTKEKSKSIDDYKDKLAQEHGIKVIRIDCEFSDAEFIKNNILKSELNILYNLSSINWNKCSEYGMSNLSKMACDLWNNSKGKLTCPEIGLIMGGIGRNTITRWLKIWNKLGLCDYDAKESIRKNNANKSKCKTNCKMVEILKDDISLGIFASCAELSRQSEELFGVKLLSGEISKVSIGKRKSHKGFTFKYVEDSNNQQSI